MKGRRISTQLTVTQCVESVSVQGRQSEQINSYTRMFVKFRETILVTGECQTNIYRSIILYSLKLKLFNKLLYVFQTDHSIETPCMYHVENIMYTNIK